MTAGRRLSTKEMISAKFESTKISISSISSVLAMKLNLSLSLSGSYRRFSSINFSMTAVELVLSSIPTVLAIICFTTSGNSSNASVASFCLSGVSSGFFPSKISCISCLSFVFLLLFTVSVCPFLMVCPITDTAVFTGAFATTPLILFSND